MENAQELNPLSKIQKISLLIAALILALGLIFLRGGLSNQSPLDSLARKSLEPEVALNNGRPTVFEFYADWCQVCREMAPSVLSIEQDYANQIDFVLINVDNPRWDNLIEEFDVNGIPQFNFFDLEGQLLGRSVGAMKSVDLISIAEALSKSESIPDKSFIGINNNVIKNYSSIQDKKK